MGIENLAQDSVEIEEVVDRSSTESKGSAGLASRKMLEEVYKALPAERMQRYLEQANGNPYEALARYRWNTQLSAAVFETIGHFEVSFRNRIDQALTSRSKYLNRTEDWLDNVNELSPKAIEAINDAKERAKKHPGFQRGHVIAELNFSFWRRILDEKNERFFGNAILRLYPDQKSRTGARNSLMLLRGLVDPIYSLRNRVAHHEPVSHINLRARRDDMLTLIAVESKELSRWVGSNCRLNALAPKPGDPTP